MIEGKGKKSMLMGILGVAFAVFIGVTAADMYSKAQNKDADA